MLFPLTMFCCGCRVITGVWIILACHLALCSLCVVFTVCNLILDIPTMTAAQSPVQQLYATGWSLIGIPLIVSAFYGVFHRVDINIRLYLYYILCSFVVSVVGLFALLFSDDVCDMKADGTFTGAFAASFGEAFVCGFMQIFVYIFTASAILTQAYFIWVIWSLCEDVHFGKGGPELAELLPSKADAIHKKCRPGDGPYTDIVGLAHAKIPGPYPFAFSTPATVGMPGQPTIFGGTSHEMNYPPSPLNSAF
eukprot:TRINITY_DN49583_c0_g1_i1.p1 TRINITY_DN49583_c0_g1~~TRINITY_DN49583_c0_g1_i1.p1  ORF type:complete len:251 (+),score=31.54 TRINITY_DN49583_c0_g1_i1:112-864(+)